MLLKIALWTHPRVWVEKEKFLRASTRSSTITIVGLNMKKLVSKFLLLYGKKQAILLYFLLPPLLFCLSSWIHCKEKKEYLKFGYNQLEWLISFVFQTMSHIIIFSLIGQTDILLVPNKHVGMGSHLALHFDWNQIIRVTSLNNL